MQVLQIIQTKQGMVAVSDEKTIKKGEHYLLMGENVNTWMGEKDRIISEKSLKIVLVQEDFKFELEGLPQFEVNSVAKLGEMDEYYSKYPEELPNFVDNNKLKAIVVETKQVTNSVGNDGFMFDDSSVIPPPRIKVTNGIVKPLKYIYHE